MPTLEELEREGRQPAVLWPQFRDLLLVRSDSCSGKVIRHRRRASDSPLGLQHSRGRTQVLRQVSQRRGLHCVSLGGELERVRIRVPGSPLAGQRPAHSGICPACPFSLSWIISTRRRISQAMMIPSRLLISMRAPFLGSLSLQCSQILSRDISTLSQRYSDPSFCSCGSQFTLKHNYGKGGILRHKDLYQLWKEPEYPENMHALLIKLIQVRARYFTKYLEQYPDIFAHSLPTLAYCHHSLCPCVHCFYYGSVQYSIRT